MPEALNIHRHIKNLQSFRVYNAQPLSGAAGPLNVIFFGSLYRLLTLV